MLAPVIPALKVPSCDVAWATAPSPMDQHAPAESDRRPVLRSTTMGCPGGLPAVDAVSLILLRRRNDSNQLGGAHVRRGGHGVGILDLDRRDEHASESRRVEEALAVGHDVPAADRGLGPGWGCPPDEL